MIPIIPSHRRNLAYDGRASMYCVQVSAFLLTFPKLCCCCGFGGADGRFLATATRTTGKRVIRIDTKSWDFPIWRECQRWIRRQQRANAARFWFVALGVLARTCAFAGVGLFSLPFVDAKIENRALVLASAVIAVALAGLLVGLATLAYQGLQRRRAAADNVKPAGHCAVKPVIYREWYGTVHTFYFACEDFAQQFILANATKVLDW